MYKLNYNFPLSWVPILVGLLVSKVLGFTDRVGLFLGSIAFEGGGTTQTLKKDLRVLQKVCVLDT